MRDVTLARAADCFLSPRGEEGRIARQWEGEGALRASSSLGEKHMRQAAPLLTSPRRGEEYVGVGEARHA